VQNYFEVKLFSKIVNLKQNLQVIIEQVVGSNNALNQCYTFVQWHPLNIFTEHLDKILLIISKSLLYYLHTFLTDHPKTNHLVLA